MDIISQSNQILRKLASRFSNRSKLRKGLSVTWTKLLRRANLSVTIPIGPRQIRVIPEVRSLSNDYEEESLNVWLKLVSSGMVIWDIGANIGIYTILSAEIVGKKGLVKAWEPTPSTHDILTKHLILNNVTAIATPIQKAVSSRDGEKLEFGCNPVSMFDPTNRLGSSGRETIEVSIESLDGIAIRENRVVDLIKIDIEGAEVDALEGAKTLMGPEGCRPIIMVGVHPMFIPEFNRSVNEIHHIIQQRKYSSYNISGLKESPLNYKEYLLIPDEKLDQTLKRLGWVSM